VLTWLDGRGVSGCRAYLGQYLYGALVSDGVVLMWLVSVPTERLFAGDVTALVNHLLTSQEVAPGDLARLRDLIDDAESRGKEDR
jgi:hypothetical protein